MSEDIEKIWLTADRLLEDSYRLARKIMEADFRPTHIVGIWRGGAPVGIAVQEFLAYHGHEADHIAIRTSSYSGIDKQNKEVRVFALGYLIDTLDPADRLLVIDDVFDSGRSIEAFLNELQLRCRHNMPQTVAVATVYWKPKRSTAKLKPDFWVYECDDWLVFPHELCGLSEAEIRAHKPQAGIVLGDQ